MYTTKVNNKKNPANQKQEIKCLFLIYNISFSNFNSCGFKRFDMHA